MSPNGFVQAQQVPRPFSDAYLRLVRNGNFFTGYTSVNGINWQFAFYAFVPMTSCIEVGMFVESINVNATTSAQFDNVIVNGVPVNPLTAPDMSVELSDDLFQVKKASVFPNPTSGALTIVSEVELASIRISNILGQEMMTVNTPNTTSSIDVGHLAKGVYTITFVTENGTWTEQFVKR